MIHIYIYTYFAVRHILWKHVLLLIADVDCPGELLFRECITCCPMHCKIEQMCIDSKLQCLDGCYCPDGSNITLSVKLTTVLDVKIWRFNKNHVSVSRFDLWGRSVCQGIRLSMWAPRYALPLRTHHSGRLQQLVRHYISSLPECMKTY